MIRFFSLLPGLPFLRRDRSSSPALFICVLILVFPDVFMLSQLVVMPVYCHCLAFSFPLPQMHAAFMACIFTEICFKDLFPYSDFPPYYFFRTRRGKELQIAGIEGVLKGKQHRAISFHKTKLLLLMTCLLKFYTNKAI